MKHNHKVYWCKEA